MIKIRRKAIVELDLEEEEAEQLAADVFYLLEHTKSLSGTVEKHEVNACIDSQERLAEFVKTMQKALRQETRTR